MSMVTGTSDEARASQARSSVPNILSIAGTDPTGGAGIQADLKSFAAHRGYGMAVVTALVAQNTQGVRQIHVPDAEFLRAQLYAVADDVRIDGVKIGMLGTTETIRTVAAWWDALRARGDSSGDDVAPAGPRPTLVIDPVMVATSGDRLLEEEAEDALRDFLSRADIITPNVSELALLAHAEPAASDEDLLAQARAVADTYDVLVLAKGGHLRGDQVRDALVHPAGAGGQRPPEAEFTGPRIDTQNTHGTGCSVSAALATLRARGLSWEDAVGEAKAWMSEALETSSDLDVGQGHGPINHLVRLWR
jgi:hydroxymethylpyrimidine kinase/phosphomethylpyrimidine kinase